MGNDGTRPSSQTYFVCIDAVLDPSSALSAHEKDTISAFCMSGFEDPEPIIPAHIIALLQRHTRSLRFSDTLVAEVKAIRRQYSANAHTAAHVGLFTDLDMYFIAMAAQKTRHKARGGNVGTAAKRSIILPEKAEPFDEADLDDGVAQAAEMAR